MPARRARWPIVGVWLVASSLAAPCVAAEQPTFDSSRFFQDLALRYMIERHYAGPPDALDPSKLPEAARLIDCEEVTRLRPGEDSAGLRARIAPAYREIAAAPPNGAKLVAQVKASYDPIAQRLTVGQPGFNDLMFELVLNRNVLIRVVSQGRNLACNAPAGLFNVKQYDGYDRSGFRAYEPFGFVIDPVPAFAPLIDGMAMSREAYDKLSPLNTVKVTIVVTGPHFGAVNGAFVTVSFDKVTVDLATPNDYPVAHFE